MFNSLGLFDKIPCPEGDRCSLLNCIFAHSDKETLPPTTVATASTSAVPRPLSPEPNNKPPLKRKREDVNKEDEEQATTREDPNPKVQKTDKPQKEAHSSGHRLDSIVKRVSPPLINNGRPSSKDKETHETPKDTPNEATKARESGHVSRPVQKETLNPRHLTKPPASHAVRMSILIKLHEAMARLNDLLRSDTDSSKKPLVLSKDELVSMALDEEEKVAKENSAVYSNVVKLRIMKLKKMAQRDWEEDVLNYLQPKGTKITNQTTANSEEQKVSTGLSSKEEIAVLTHLTAPRDKLEKLGVVTSAPTEDETRLARSGTDAAQGWEKCDRCGGRFQVFPGRQEDGLLASGGSCNYHYARSVRPPKQKTDHIVGHREASYPCCNETVGTSTGCTKGEWHVYKISEVKRLAAVLQFQTTPHQPDKGVLPPVCFDCEMGYTTLGLELIRLTAVTWPQNNKLLDVLVRPIGEILDLNSRFSGIRAEHFAKAIPYGTASRKDMQASDATILEIVESPSVARSLLFEHLQPETPLIAHSIENDLNACRIIHPTIVDTALLYPHPGGLPLRFGLRMLAKKYLDRAIQTGGGSQGHDSMEDAKATGDLVRTKVGETWKTLKRTGWEIKAGELVAPASMSAAPKASTDIASGA